MRRSFKSKNPFYVLLVATGILFVLTATGYCVMAFRDARPLAATEVARAPRAPHPLDTWMRRNGETALLVELAFLGVFVFGAIATDNYWQRRANERR
jgi:hypothetical protein